MASLNIVVSIMVVELVAGLIAKLNLCKSSKLCGKLRNKLLPVKSSAAWIRFLLQLNQDLLLMTLLTILSGD